MKDQPGEIEWMLGVFNRMLFLCTKNTLDQHGLNEVSNPRILFALKRHAPDMTASQKDIADHLGIKPPTVATSLKRMESTGVIKKTGDSEDQRRNLITLTEKGLDWVNHSETIISAMQQKVLKDFTEEDKQKLTEYLLKMIDNMEQMGVHPPKRLKRSI